MRRGGLRRTEAKANALNRMEQLRENVQHGHGAEIVPN